MLSCIKGSNRKSEGEEEEDSEWGIFSLKELQSATDDFNRDHILGGIYGIRYLGQLCDGSRITVKRLYSWSKNDKAKFHMNVEKLARLCHENLLNLRGYCAKGTDRLLVYDYIPYPSLLYHLRSPECHHLDWTRRMNIALATAEAIAYLHSHGMIHRGIKPSNVLLDGNFRPLVADFGLKDVAPDQTQRGDSGYGAPEFLMTGRASESSDAHSFGILLLVLACGQEPVEKLRSTRRLIAEWALILARRQRFRRIADPRLNGNFVEEELRRFISVGIMCADLRPEKRPTMVQVIELLKGNNVRLASAKRNKIFTDTDSGTEDSSETEGEAMEPRILRSGWTTSPRYRCTEFGINHQHCS